MIEISNLTGDIERENWRDPILQVIAAARKQGEIWPGSWTAQVTESAIKKSLLLIASQKNQLSGFVLARAHASAAEIDLVWVTPELRGQGLFKRLLGALVQAVPAVPIWLEVHEQNQKAISAYLRVGFQKVGTRPRYYPDGGAALLFELNLLE